MEAVVLVKQLLFKYRFTLVTFFTISIFVSFNYEFLLRRAAPNEGVVFLLAFSFVMLLSSILVTSRAASIRVVWGIVMPEISSFIGYGCLYSYIRNAGHATELHFLELITVATLMPFLTARIWMISVVLGLFGIGDYYLMDKKLKLKRQ